MHIKDDIYRYYGNRSFISFLKGYFLIPGIRFLFWYRIASNFKYRKSLFLVYFILRLILRHFSYKFGFDIPAHTKIGKGFYIGHFSGIVISGSAIIGNNVNISQGVTIGVSSRGQMKGVPIIGNEVYIGPGAKIIGKIKIGNNVAIGANAVVTKDIPDNAVAVGVPARIISYNGSNEYILNKI